MTLSEREFLRMMKQANAEMDAEMVNARQKFSGRKHAIETVWKMQNPKLPVPTAQKKTSVGKGELTNAIKRAIDAAPEVFDVRDIEELVSTTVTTDRATISSRLKKIAWARKDVTVEREGLGRRPTKYRKLTDVPSAPDPTPKSEDD